MMASQLCVFILFLCRRYEEVCFMLTYYERIYVCVCMCVLRLTSNPVNIHITLIIIVV